MPPSATNKTRRQKGRRARIGRPIKSPRLIILDNDETTGSYWALYKLIHLFRDYDIENIRIQDLIPHITTFCINSGIFRPGIEQLIHTIQQLKDSNKIDQIIMYTYQQEAIGRKNNLNIFYNSHGQQLNIPIVLNYCFGYIASKYKVIQPFFQTVITRNIHHAYYGLSVDEPINAKSLDVVFKEARIHPTHDLQGITFIDDCYMNTDYPQKLYGKKTILGELSSVYISSYAMSAENLYKLHTEAGILYKNILSNYISSEIYTRFIHSIEQFQLGKYAPPSNCNPRGIEHVYKPTDLTKLAERIRKYYNLL
jgi:hypothetical protein